MHMYVCVCVPGYEDDDDGDHDDDNEITMMMTTTIKLILLRGARNNVSFCSTQQCQVMRSVRS